MSDCVYCHARRGKRACPALGGLICSACCGAHRRKEIACPSDCRWLQEGDRYQRSRLAEAFGAARQETWESVWAAGGEPAARLLHLLDLLTYRHCLAAGPRQGAGDILPSYEELRRGLSPIHVPQAAPSRFGQELAGELKEVIRNERIDSEVARAVVERAISFAEGFGGGTREGAERFVEGLMGYYEAVHPETVRTIRESREQAGRLVIPSGRLAR